MRKRRRWETLVGSTQTLDFLLQQNEVEDASPHPLQELVEEIISTLSEKERMVFYMRYGEELPIRTIAKKMGYNSHQVVQVLIDRIETKVREAVERGNS